MIKKQNRERKVGKTYFIHIFGSKNFQIEKMTCNKILLNQQKNQVQNDGLQAINLIKYQQYQLINLYPQIFQMAYFSFNFKAAMLNSLTTPHIEFHPSLKSAFTRKKSEQLFYEDQDFLQPMGRTNNQIPLDLEIKTNRIEPQQVQNSQQSCQDEGSCDMELIEPYIPNQLDLKYEELKNSKKRHITIDVEKSQKKCLSFLINQQNGFQFKRKTLQDMFITVSFVRQSTLRRRVGQFITILKGLGLIQCLRKGGYRWTGKIKHFVHSNGAEHYAISQIVFQQLYRSRFTKETRSQADFVDQMKWWILKNRVDSFSVKKNADRISKKEEFLRLKEQGFPASNPEVIKKLNCLERRIYECLKVFNTVGIININKKDQNNVGTIHISSLMHRLGDGYEITNEDLQKQQ